MTTAIDWNIAGGSMSRTVLIAGVQRWSSCSITSRMVFRKCQQSPTCLVCDAAARAI